MNNRAYVRKITTIISLTSAPAILTLPLFFKECLGWILGVIASLVNFLWLAYSIDKSLKQLSAKSKLSAVKGAYQRYLFLFLYSILILTFIRPNVITFGLGLLVGQAVIYINEIILNIKKSKYYRGQDD